MQSYLTGVPMLRVGYRDRKNHVYKITQKSIKEVLKDVREYDPWFDSAINMGRVYAILSALLEYHRSVEPPVLAEDSFKLHIKKDGEAYVTSLKKFSRPSLKEFFRSPLKEFPLLSLKEFLRSSLKEFPLLSLKEPPRSSPKESPRSSLKELPSPWTG